MTRNKQVIFNLTLFVLALIALHIYRLYHMQESTPSCIEQHAFAAALPTARTEVEKACAILADKRHTAGFNTRERALALCILRDPLALGTTNQNAIALYLEPCYTAYLKK